MTDTIELGLDTFGDISDGPDGRPLHAAQVIRNLVDEAVLADEVGVDFIGVGEHHRADFAVSSPEMVLAAVASRTKRIRLGSAVTVLSSDDPIRVFQRFSTLDALSDGRAEVILGRGSFIESFPLFGFDLNQYEALFDDKLNLFAAALKQQPITWRGTTRPPLEHQSVYPKTESGGLTTWIGVGGTPQSAMRAAKYGMPMMLAIIGGDPRRFAPFADLYRRTLKEMGKARLPVGVHSHGFVGETDAQAKEDLFADYKRMRDKIGAERGWPPLTRADFEREIEHGSLYVGSAQTVARKIAATVKALEVSRFDMKYSAGPLSHEKMMRSIELYGRKVIPLVRELLA
jgi:probable LLM family oxidoreductase